MKKLKIIYLIFLLTLVSQGLKALVDSTDYTYLQAKYLAEKNSKNYLLIFYAPWDKGSQHVLKEIQLMDQSQAYSTQNILVKVDIDSYEGKALQRYYKVHSIPCLLKFNANHQLVERKSFAYQGKQIKELLVQLSELDHINSQTKEDMNRSPNLEPEVRVCSNSSNASCSKLKAFSSYTVQIGAFKKEQNAIKSLSDMKGYGLTALRIVSDQTKSNTTFKLVSGEFDHISKAQHWKKYLTSLGINGYIVHLNLNARL